MLKDRVKNDVVIDPDNIDEDAFYKGEIISFGKLTWRRFCKHKLAVAGMIILGVLVLAVIFAPILTPYSFVETHPEDVVGGQPLPPCQKYILGTDNLGRDYLTRLLYGGRTSLLVGFLAVAVSLVIGIPLGCIAGYYGGTVDMIICRIIDFLNCIPMFFLLLVANMFFPSGIISVVVIIGVFGWCGIARQVRAQFLSLKKQEFVQSAIALGFKDKLVIFKHILPNALMPVVITATSSVAGAILYESSLSYLGLGVQEPIPTWGAMLSKAQIYIRSVPTMAIFPGLLITLVTLSLSFIGDGLRDALDPRTRL